MEIKTVAVSEMLPSISVGVFKDIGCGVISSFACIEESIQFFGNPLGNLQLRIDVDSTDGSQIFVFHVDGGKNVTRKPKDSATDSYMCRVPTFRKPGEKYYYTLPNSNNIRLMRINSSGKIELFRVSVVSQLGEFYAVVERTGEYQVCLDLMGQLVIPGLNWPSLEKVIFFNGGFLPSQLPNSDDYESIITDTATAEEKTKAILGENQGRVLWYSIGDGIGAVVLADGRVARVNWRTIVPRGEIFNIFKCEYERHGLAYLMPGEVVGYENCGEPHQTTKRSTSFQWELEGVAVVEKIVIVE